MPKKFALVPMKQDWTYDPALFWAIDLESDAIKRLRNNLNLKNGCVIIRCLTKRIPYPCTIFTHTTFLPNPIQERANNNLFLKTRTPIFRYPNS